MARIVWATPRTLVRTIERHCSGDSSRKPREAPKPALAKTTSMPPKRSRVGLDQRLDLIPLGHVAGLGQHVVAAAELARRAPRAAPRGARRARGGGPRSRSGLRGCRADARAGAGDQDRLRVGHRLTFIAAPRPDRPDRGRPCDNRGPDGSRPQATDPSRRRALGGRSAGRRADLHVVQRVDRGTRALRGARRGSERRELPARPARSSATSATAPSSSFEITDRDGGDETLPVAYTGIVPDPFREGREVIVTGNARRERDLRGREGQPDHQVPVEVRRRGRGQHRTSSSSSCSER